MLQVARLLTFAGGGFDICIWIIDGVMADAQTVTLVLHQGHGTAGGRAQGAHFFPPIAAFAGGMTVAAWLRRPVEECVMYDIGAAAGTFATKYIPDFALGFPVVALIMVVCVGATRPDEERA
jgi:hypothetical protein